MSNAHADLEGLSNCTQCHDLGKKVSKAKCITCHTEISDLIMNNQGFHANKDVISKDCWSCHGEHYGRNFQIVRFDEQKFDHNKSGFELKGSHKKLKCEQCHTQKFIVSEKLKKKGKTFLGLKTSCNNCHEDVHQNTLSENCINCHTEDKFVPAINFNHLNTNFKLTGSHQNVDCENCHPKVVKNDKPFQKFANVRFASCENCHNDVHKSKFGKDCKSCHSTDSFRDVKLANGFNHSRTDFPLVGKHKKVKCENCHKGSLTHKPKYANCYDCHDDYHKGEFINNNAKTDCNECHNEKGFSPSLFTIERHAKTNFELKYAHAATPCNVCHLKETKWQFNIEGEKCVDCHRNAHGEEISQKFFGENNCENCHSSWNWRVEDFDHSKTDYDLTGKHKLLTCSNCHFSFENKKVVQQKFVSLNSDCTQCHFDIHYGQFIKANKEQCSNCHTSNLWKPELFDHSKTRFALDGKHEKLACVQCHKIVKDNNVQFVKYKIEETSCKSCHT